jgi:hypothetical protein
MSPRGANLRKGSPQRAADDRKIRERYLQKLAAENGRVSHEGPSENPDMPTEVERQNSSWEFRRLRSQHWEKPALVDGQLVARELPKELVLPWEEYTSVVARERPGYSDWRVEQRPYGTVLVGPNRLPELLSDDQATPT